MYNAVLCKLASTKLGRDPTVVHSFVAKLDVLNVELIICSVRHCLSISEPLEGELLSGRGVGYNNETKLFVDVDLILARRILNDLR